MRVSEIRVNQIRVNQGLGVFYSNPAKHTYCQQVIVAFALKIIRFGSIRISKIIMCPKA